MPDSFERLMALAQDPAFDQQAGIILRQRGFTALPPGYGSAAEFALDYFAHNDPAVINRFLREHERVHGPLPERAPAPPAQQPQQQAPVAKPAAQQQPQQRPQSKIDPQMGQKLLKLLAVDRVAAQAKKMRGGSAFRQYLTPELERTAAAALKKIGAVIPQGHTAGETYLAGLSILKDMSPRELNVIAEESKGALGDATELRQALSKLTAHDYSDKVGAQLKKDAVHDPHRGGEPDEKEKAKAKDSTRDVVAAALREQKARGERNGEPPKTPRRVYSREELETRKLKDKFFPENARPIALDVDVAREIANEARDAAQAEAAINGDSGSVASEPSGADNA